MTMEEYKNFTEALNTEHENGDMSEYEALKQTLEKEFHAE
jgi:hypothetical protein